MASQPNSFFEGFSGRLLDDFNPEKLNWKDEIKYVGALAGSVTGSYVSTQLSLSLLLRIATVIGSAYSGAMLATVGYGILSSLAEMEATEETPDEPEG